MSTNRQQFRFVIVKIGKYLLFKYDHQYIRGHNYVIITKIKQGYGSPKSLPEQKDLPFFYRSKVEK